VSLLVPVFRFGMLGRVEIILGLETPFSSPHRRGSYIPDLEQRAPINLETQRIPLLLLERLQRPGWNFLPQVTEFLFRDGPGVSMG